MNGRPGLYKAICLLLCAYGVVAVVAAGAPGRSLYAGPFRYFAFVATHVFLVVMAGLHFLRPVGARSPRSILLTLALALVVVSGAVPLSQGGSWVHFARLGLLGLAYFGLRASALRT